MPRHLSEGDIEGLVRAIDTLAVATWDAVVRLARQRLGHAYSRQSLSRHPRISDALAARRKRLRQERPGRQPRPATESEAVLLDRVEYLKAEIARLKADNEAMMAQFAIWSYNTHVLGIPDDRLDAPLQPVNRNYSEDAT
ncbi:MAG: hypothetical protein OXQ93_00475 [Gemmatimonadota bacterium]|nr:hypothetical protein [Gemmatimonadota bacterium]